MVGIKTIDNYINNISGLKITKSDFFIVSCKYSSLSSNFNKIIYSDSAGEVDATNNIDSLLLNNTIHWDKL